jgi:dienelactone hydrolase
MIQTRLVGYEEAGQPLQGFMAWDDAVAERRPAVLVAHTIRGRSEFECEKACALARLGYAGFALDVYGEGRVADDHAVAEPWMRALLNDRTLLQRRLQRGLEAAGAQGEVDPTRIAAIGYCFGGLAVLDLARVDDRPLGVASFHGLLDPPPGPPPASISARVLVLHGWDDPLATPEALVAAAAEFTAAGADWQIHAYGHAAHSFTNPAAASPERGVAYHPAADRRSWQALESFLRDLFG